VSSSRRKCRKAHFSAPSHVRRKVMTTSLSKDLRNKHVVSTRTLKMTVPRSPPNVERYTRISSHHHLCSAGRQRSPPLSRMISSCPIYLHTDVSDGLGGDLSLHQPEVTDGQLVTMSLVPGTVVSDVASKSECQRCYHWAQFLSPFSDIWAQKSAWLSILRFGVEHSDREVTVTGLSLSKRTVTVMVWWILTAFVALNTAWLSH